MSSFIDFAVSGTITLTSPLPAIARQVTIDARSAPGTGRGPRIEINFNRNAGLRYVPGSAGSQLLGLAIDNARGDGVTLEASSITLNRDYIGLNRAGTAFGNRGDGVYVSPSSSDNVIGRNDSGVSGVVANVISGNAGNGITLAGSSRNTVAANRIGTNPAGSWAIGNGGEGIAIVGPSSRNEIGGTEFVDRATGQVNNPTGDKGTQTPVFVVPPLGNLISGNGHDGVLIAAGAHGNVLNGNFIGTTADGDAAIGNHGDGVWIDRADGNSLVGCKFVNNPFVYYNVVSGNHGNGLRVTDSNNTVVQGDFFGAGANNADAVPNRLDGIRVGGSSANTQVGGVIPLGNVSAGNGRNGIEVTGTAHGFITFNTFGGLMAFGGAAPNRNDGLLITSTGGDNEARTNVFSGNDNNGIELAGDASGVTIDPCIAGLNTDGNGPLANGGDGVLITGNAHGNTIGGTRRSVIRQNTFSDNGGFGLAITGRAHRNRVFSTYIGTLILGVEPQGNMRGGVLISGSAYENLIGTGSFRNHNIISANRGNGVTLEQRTSLNAVVHNYIGIGRTGRNLPNTGRPVVDRGVRNLILGNRT
jgi:parallel beta-helix repeat protein